MIAARSANSDFCVWLGTATFLSLLTAGREKLGEGKVLIGRPNAVSLPGVVMLLSKHVDDIAVSGFARAEEGRFSFGDRKFVPSSRCSGPAVPGPGFQKMD